MSEQKVWVEKLPESCKKCAYSQINLALGVETRICGLQYGFISIDIDKFPNCPLQSLQTHDLELIKKVCEKIREHLSEQKKSLKDTFSPYSNGKAFIISAVEESLNKIEKEYEK